MGILFALPSTSTEIMKKNIILAFAALKLDEFEYMAEPTISKKSRTETKSTDKEDAKENRKTDKKTMTS